MLKNHFKLHSNYKCLNYRQTPCRQQKPAFVDFEGPCLRIQYKTLRHTMLAHFQSIQEYTAVVVF